MGLFIAAAITTAVALIGVLVLLRRADDWRALALAFLVALPLQPLMMFAVRLPFDGFLRTSAGHAGWAAIVALFYAPLTEEPAKWLTAVLPRVRRAILRQPVVAALAAGAGFAIGEIWFLAVALNSPDYAELPFWMFGGFMLERLAVCFLHGAFLAPAFVALARGGSFLAGGLFGMLMHFLLNFPLYLANIDAFGLGRAWFVVLLIWTVAVLVISLLLVWHLARTFEATKAP